MQESQPATSSSCLTQEFWEQMPPLMEKLQEEYEILLGQCQVGMPDLEDTKLKSSLGVVIDTLFISLKEAGVNVDGKNFSITQEVSNIPSSFLEKGDLLKKFYLVEEGVNEKGNLYIKASIDPSRQTIAPVLFSQLIQLTLNEPEASTLSHLWLAQHQLYSTWPDDTSIAKSTTSHEGKAEFLSRYVGTALSRTSAAYRGFNIDAAETGGATIKQRDQSKI